MTAVLATLIAKQCKALLYLDIRDLFNDTMKGVLSNHPLRFVLPVFSLLEKWTFNSAKKINLISGGFLPYARTVAPNTTFSVFTHGVDDLFLGQNFQTEKPNQKTKILYAGNIGQGQGLENIVPRAAKSLEGSAEFILIGDGGRRASLEKTAQKLKLQNLKLLNPMGRDKLLEHYKGSDILLLHLNDFEALHKVLPSKIFEYAATGKPILAGVSGYAADFLSRNVDGTEIFIPNDINAMEKCFEKIIRGPSIFDRTEFCEKFLRSKIARDIAFDITHI